MEANKNIQVVMLPTEDHSNIYLNSIEEIGNLVYNNSNFPFHEDMIKCNDFIPQHLYFTSDEKPEVGDWCVYFGTDIMKYDHSEVWDKNKCRKIIATTDTKLNLPQPSQAFIEKYCKVGGIDKVMVEYNTYPISPNGNIVGTDRPYPYDGLVSNFTIDYIVKVNSHNEITIHPIKDSWNREEVIKLLNAYGNHVAAEFSDCDCSHTEPFSITEDEWIDENL